MAFRDAAELRHYMGGIFEVAFEDEELRTKLTDTGLVLRFVFSDPSADLVVDLGAAAVLPEGADAQPTATMFIGADTANSYWQGKTNLALAMAKGKVKIDGSAAALLKLVPLGKKLFPIYIDILRGDDRADLLV
jgi:hypothetical protein